MFLICPKCGQTEEFSQAVYGNTNYSERIYYDGDWEIVDNDDYEIYKSEQTDSDPVECCACNHLVKEFSTKNERIHYIWKHTTKDKKWSIAKLQKNKRDKTALLTYISEKV